MPAHPDSPALAIVVPPASIGQRAYLVRCAAAAPDVGTTAHAMLAWALLESIGGDDLRDVVAALDLPDDAGDPRDPVAAPARHTAEELALQLCAHFTSEGRSDLAQLYQDGHRILSSPR
jgi:hypothetical protein